MASPAIESMIRGLSDRQSSTLRDLFYPGLPTEDRVGVANCALAYVLDVMHTRQGWSIERMQAVIDDLKTCLL